MEYAINAYFWLMVARKWKIIAVISALALIVFLVLAGQWMRLPWTGVSAWEAIPASSVVLVKSNVAQIEQASAENRWPVMQGMIPVRHLIAFDSLLQTLNVSGEIREQEVAIGGWNLGISEPHWIIAVDIKSSNRNAGDVLETKLGSLPARQLARGKAFQFSAGGVDYSVSALQSLVVFSTASIALEAAQNQFQNYAGRINRQKAFLKLNKVHEDAPGPVMMFQSEYSAGYLGPLVKPGHLNRIRDLEHIGWFSAAFSEMEGRLVPKDGYWQPIGVTDFLRHHSEVSPGQFNFLPHIPQDVSVLIAASHQEPNWPLANKASSSAFWQQQILPWLGKGAVYAMLEPLQEPVQPYRFMILDIENESAFDQSMGVHLLGLSDEQKFTHREYSIFLLDEQDLSGPVFGAAFNDIFKPYVIKREGVLIFANSLQWLHHWLDMLDEGKSLTANNYNQHLLNKYHYHFWMNPAYGAFYQEYFARNPDAGFWQDWAAAMQQMPASGFSAQYDRRGFQLEFAQVQNDTLPAAATEPKRQVSGQLWQTEADRRIVKGPLRVLSIARSVVIMAQDADNRIYAYHTNGTLHWSRSLDGPMLSTPVLTASGHLLFNTANRVYLVRPEDGANVDQSPYALPVSTDVGLVYNSVRRDDSYYIFGSNGNIYGFQSDGIPLSRMRRKDAGHATVQPIAFEFNGTFHMAMVDKRNRLYCFDETGRDRFQPITLEGDFTPYLGVDIHKLTQRLLMSGADGRAQVTNMQGSQFRLNLAVEGAGNRHFAFVDLWGDSRKDYLVASNTHIALHAYEGTDFKRVWMQRAPQNIRGLQTVERENSNYPAIAVQLADNKLWLLDESGKPMLQDLLDTGQAPVIVGNDIIVNRNGQLVSLRMR